LIVQDSEDYALLLIGELRRAGYDVSYERVETGPAIEAALKRGTWDVVISDHSMPSFNGIEGLAIVQRRSPDLPFIFVSGTMGEEIAVAAMRAGAHDYLMKGNLPRLAPVVERELRDAESRRQRRITEERLRMTSELLRSVFAASPLAITATDAEGLVKLWNPAAERLFGWTEAEATGQPIPTVPAGREDEREELRSRVFRGESLTDVATQRQKRDGSLVDVNVSMAATHDGKGKADGVIVVAQDLTARKQLEAQFLQAQKMEAVGRLAGGVAHDFNNLLTVILSYCDMLLETVPADDFRHEDIGEIRKAGEAAATLARQLLAFSRQNVIQPRVVELNAIVEHTTTMLKRLIGAGIAIDTRLDSGAGQLKADAGQIEQVIMNLAINARDAMSGGGTLTIETRRADASDVGAEAMTRAPLGYCLLAVSDTGTGMDAATQARMFEPFFTTKEAAKGTGLGLSTVYGIVKQYEGVIRVRSAPGAGTTFRVYLPAAAEAGSAPAVAAAAGKGARGGETILVVDDEPAVRAVARRVLEPLGYVVLEAPDAQTALRLARARAGEIHLLLTDVVMPGMSGHDLVERFQRARPGTKVLFFSGYSEEGEELSGARDAGHAFIQKPFTPDQLARKVRHLLG
jgi:PAS domain S-box-containing protein